MRFKSVYLKDKYTVVGPLEKDGLLKYFDESLNDYYFGEKTFEAAEVKMQSRIIEGLINNNGIETKDINFLIGGDLINQISITNYTMRKFDIPFLGVYSACSTFTESLCFASVLVDNYKLKNVISLASSHNLTAERQYRFPVEYGSPRPNSATFTATGAAGCILTNKITNIKIESATVGSVVDKGINDVYHMGAAMAPAAADTLNKHLSDMKRDCSYYDVILTGDLGIVGSKILKDYLKKVFDISIKNHMDAGCELYRDSQETFAGGSGPVCLPLVLFNKVLKSKKYKRILILGTGALHNPCFINQHNSIPGISHAVSLEVL